MKAGCVERAIVSAGGPKLSCKYQGRASVLDGKRSMDIGPPAPALPLKRQLISETASLSSLPPSTYDYTRTEDPPLYTPGPWGAGNTVTFTTTIETSKSVYTTEVVFSPNETSTTGTPVLTTTSTTTSSSIPSPTPVIPPPTVDTRVINTSCQSRSPWLSS